MCQTHQLQTHDSLTNLSEQSNKTVIDSEKKNSTMTLQSISNSIPKIENDLKGFLITCDRGRESKCIREMLDLMHEVRETFSISQLQKWFLTKWDEFIRFQNS
jgi:hypothetical protein